MLLRHHHQGPRRAHRLLRCLALTDSTLKLSPPRWARAVNTNLISTACVQSKSRGCSASIKAPSSEADLVRVPFHVSLFFFSRISMKLKATCQEAAKKALADALSEDAKSTAKTLSK